MIDQKVKLIEQVPLSLVDKVALLLMYANQKPSAWISILGNSLKDKSFDLENRVREVERVLRKLELPYSTGSKERWQIAPPQEIFPEGLYEESFQVYTSKKEELADKLKRAVENRDTHEIGRLMGYPKTAIQAFHGEIPRLKSRLSDGTVYDFFTQFIFSQEHFAEEYQTSKRWNDTVKKLSPEIYGTIIECMGYKEIIEDRYGRKWVVK